MMLHRIFAAKLRSMQKEAAEETRIRGASMEMELDVEDRHNQADKRQQPTRVNSSPNQWQAKSRGPMGKRLTSMDDGSWCQSLQDPWNRYYARGAELVLHSMHILSG